jgi:hypothetical protein
MNLIKKGVHNGYTLFNTSNLKNVSAKKLIESTFLNEDDNCKSIGIYLNAYKDDEYALIAVDIDVKNAPEFNKKCMQWIKYKAIKTLVTGKSSENKLGKIICLVYLDELAEIKSLNVKHGISSIEILHDAKTAWVSGDKKNKKDYYYIKDGFKHPLEIPVSELDLLTVDDIEELFLLATPFSKKINVAHIGRHDELVELVNKNIYNVSINEVYKRAINCEAFYDLKANPRGSEKAEDELWRIITGAISLSYGDLDKRDSLLNANSTDNKSLVYTEAVTPRHNKPEFVKNSIFQILMDDAKDRNFVHDDGLPLICALNFLSVLTATSFKSESGNKSNFNINLIGASGSGKSSPENSFNAWLDILNDSICSDPNYIVNSSESINKIGSFKDASSSRVLKESIHRYPSLCYFIDEGSDVILTRDAFKKETHDLTLKLLSDYNGKNFSYKTHSDGECTPIWSYDPSFSMVTCLQGEYVDSLPREYFFKGHSQRSLFYFIDKKPKKLSTRKKVVNQKAVGCLKAVAKFMKFNYTTFDLKNNDKEVYRKVFNKQSKKTEIHRWENYIGFDKQVIKMTDKAYDYLDTLSDDVLYAEFMGESIGEFRVKKYFSRKLEMLQKIAMILSVFNRELSSAKDLENPIISKADLVLAKEIIFYCSHKAFKELMFYKQNDVNIDNLVLKMPDKPVTKSELKRIAKKLYGKTAFSSFDLAFETLLRQKRIGLVDNLNPDAKALYEVKG